jgi:signal transduction histidine kinase/ActR/RegA family two-component response regulator
MLGIGCGALAFCIILLAIFLQIQQRQQVEKNVQALLESEQELKESEQRLKESERKAIEASRTKTMFLAIAGHELRTPLNGIIGLAELLLKNDLPEKETTYANNIYNSSKALLKTLNNTLEFAKIESGQIELENTEFSLLTFVKQIISTLSVKAKEKNIVLNYVIDQNVPQKIFGDFSRLSQIIYNLIGNAIKYTEQGSVVLRIIVQSIDPSNCLHLHFSVEDTGIGLTPEQQQKLFLPFNILQPKESNEEAGSGLGLAISMALAKAMGGEIHVTSIPGKGSCFSFVAIFSKYSSEKIGVIDQQLQPSLEEPKEISSIINKEHVPTILVVDDNPTNLLIAQAMLEKLGAKTLGATNGKEALYENSKEKIDLILMDCEMPVMDGYVATRELRKLNVHIPILAMTAHTTYEDKQNCINAGMDGFLAKPISIESLAKELVQTLPPEVISNPSFAAI